MVLYFRKCDVVSGGVDGDSTWRWELYTARCLFTRLKCEILALKTASEFDRGWRELEVMGKDNSMSLCSNGFLIMCPFTSTDNQDAFVSGLHHGRLSNTVYSKSTQTESLKFMWFCQVVMRAIRRIVDFVNIWFCISRVFMPINQISHSHLLSLIIARCRFCLMNYYYC